MSKEKADSGLDIGVFKTLMKNTDDFMYVIGKDLTFLAVSDSFVEFLGFSSSERVVGRRVCDLTTDMGLVQRHDKDDMTVLNEGRSLVDFMENFPAPNGTIYVLCSKYPIPGKDGKPCAVLCISRDVTVQYEAQEDYVEELRYLMEFEPDDYAKWLVDATAWRIVDYRSGENVPLKIPNFNSIEDYTDYTVSDAQDNDVVRRFFEEFSADSIRRLYKSGRRRQDLEYSVPLEDGGRAWVHLEMRMLTDSVSGHLMLVITLTNIDKEKSAHSELVKAAEIDAMTGVLNHDATFRHISEFLSTTGARGTHALIMVDRDHLKAINDTLGHQAGDDIIVETANALKGVFRDTDIIGRVGGDEFLVLMKDIGKLKTAKRKTSELLQSLHCICGSGDEAVESTGSIGIALFTDGDKSFEKLYAEADNALYRAKAEGRNRCSVFNMEADETDDELTAHEKLIDTVNLRTLLNRIDGGILVLHAEDGGELSPIFFSDSFLVMMGGLSQQEAFELYGNDIFDCIHPDERERVRSEYLAAFESGEPLRTNYRLVGGEGVYRWLSCGMNINKNANGVIDVFAVHTNIEKLMNREEKLASDELLFRVAFSQTSRVLCEVNIAQASLLLYSNTEGGHQPNTEVSGLPESVIRSGFIHEKSIDAFREFYAHLENGRQEDKGLFICRYFSNNQYDWASFSYQMVFDSNGKPQKAIGSIEELPNIARARERIEREEQLFKSVVDDHLAVIKTNLSRNIVEEFHASERSPFSGEQFSSYNDFYEMVCGESSFSEDVMLIELNLNRDSLINSFALGKNWVAVEYRQSGMNTPRWIKVSANLIEDPATHDLMAYIYVSDVGRRRAPESVLPITVERDPLTHLYTQSTCEKLITGMTRASAGSAFCSLAMVRMLDLPSLAARIGAENVDLEKMYLCRFLCALFDPYCVVGRYNGDSIMIFCPDSGSGIQMAQRVENAFERIDALQTAAGMTDHVKLVCGISSEIIRNASLAAMFSQTTSICDANRGVDKSTVYTFEQFVDSFRVSQESLNENSLLSVSSLEMTRPLFGAENAAMSECMAAMLAADSYDESVSESLGVLCRYYDAQRVYTLVLTSSGSSVSGLHEWVSSGHHSTLRQMSGLSLDKLPMFKRALATAKPVVLDNGSRQEKNDTELPWCFICIPVISESKVQGFMCIESPSKHKTDIALPIALMPILLHERQRFGLGASGMSVSGKDDLTGVPDHRAYENYIQSFDASAYRTVGVVYISVVKIREQNRMHGIAYVDEMLVFAAQMMSDTINKAKVFRISADEFVAVCTNCSQEAFKAQRTRYQCILQRRYPKNFCYGEAWRDKPTPIRRLISEAEELAKSGAEVPMLAPAAVPTALSDPQQLRALLGEERLFILIQPQMDIRTAKIVGGEVLARTRNSSGDMLLPSEFVASFENSGMVRELDYAIFDRALRVLEHWLSLGCSPPPLSVNFSQQTLSAETVLASALAVRSRYDVPDELVKIEISESIGKYNSAAIRKSISSMNRAGFRFVLDLGADYSGLSRLDEMSLDSVKLDRGLINSFLYNSVSKSVVENVVGICAKSSVNCIAEGVEAQTQLDALLEAGCVVAQGFYYAKPMSIEDFFKKYLRDQISQEGSNE